MQFSMKEWLHNYNKVHTLGRMLRASRPTFDDEGDYIAPETYLSKSAQGNIEFEIRTLMQRNNRYMDQCGLRMPKPLWHYERDNPKTHMSSREFQYGHLVA